MNKHKTIPCGICKEVTDSFAGNPGKWPVQILNKIYHTECLLDLLKERDQLRALLEEREKEIERLKQKYNGVA